MKTAASLWFPFQLSTLNRPHQSEVRIQNENRSLGVAFLSTLNSQP
jgi:hypothetical protein